MPPPVFVSADPCPCCGLAHKDVRLFATTSDEESSRETGRRIKLWYLCPEFGQKVPVDFMQAAPAKEKGN